MSSFVHYLKYFSVLKLKLQSGDIQYGSKSACFTQDELEIWRMILKIKRALLQCYFKLCVFHSHRLFRTWVTARKRPLWVKIDDFLKKNVLCDHEIWQMTLKNHKAFLLCYFKLCASLHSHVWIQTGITVLQRPILVNISEIFSRVPLKFDGRPLKTIGNLFYATLNFILS